MAKFDRDSRTFETRVTFIRDIFSNKYQPIEIMAHCIQYIQTTTSTPTT